VRHAGAMTRSALFSRFPFVSIIQQHDAYFDPGLNASHEGFVIQILKNIL
jgi:hypothetical protein